MPQIMEANFFQAVIFERDLEILSDEVRPNSFTHLIDINVLQIVLAVHPAAYRAIERLFRFHGEQ